MSEFTLDDGRKAERTEINPDAMTKVTEVYVEPKPQKKLTQRITERLCVCEREVETIDENTGEIVSREVQKLCEGSVSQEAVKSPMQSLVEAKLKKPNLMTYLFVGLVALQVVALAYVVFFM